ncbi:hypothetical protein J5N97_002501 [Dioscorea zingiberensis]|uniref:Uncharacterized protein n=1 Tax=Dioscorea zingiberensis TaxID=325984 RepID=A0A9D5D4X1_9LILI|nr:hypothetical protein J5N97_002501 [Dioscorea zingiberensis]
MGCGKPPQKGSDSHIAACPHQALKQDTFGIQFPSISSSPPPSGRRRRLGKRIPGD